MGLLTLGKALDATATTLLSGYIREHGISQFLNTYNRVKNIAGDELRFGDEIECGVLAIDPLTKTVKLSVRSAELLDYLAEMELRMSHQSEGCTWHPEFGAWMIESTPSRPYNNYASDLLRVERNMIIRRRRLISALKENEIAPTCTSFPLMGVDDFIYMPEPFSVPYSQSTYLPDYIVNPHPRFAALTQNIRARRGSKVDIRIPLYKDTNTPEYLLLSSDQLTKSISYINSSSSSSAATIATSSSIEPVPARDPLTGNAKFALETKTSISSCSSGSNNNISSNNSSNVNIHMDAMGFGMGMSCLQVTFQAKDIDESRYMYDQLAVLAPIMLAMTAATPFFKGRVSDVDVRWSAIAQSVDDRTRAERGDVLESELSNHINPAMAGQGIKRIPKSRYDSVSTYIYHCKGDPLCRRTFEKYNDIPCPVDDEIKQRLLTNGLDENLAHHISHLFTRDPLVIFQESVELDDTKSMDHFENIQSTNWQTCRWKPPPPQNKPGDPHIGWRTEFRSMEVQLTDFENAAFTVFIVLVTRVVLAFDLALYIPLSLVDENMKRAHHRNAVQKDKFYFRKHMAPPPVNCTSSDTPDGKVQQQQVQHMATALSPRNGTNCPEKGEPFEKIEDNFEEMTMNEIFNGKEDYYPGLIALVYAYLDYINMDPETRGRVDEYLQFISKRAKGDTVTTATWMRDFVSSHSAYHHDSILSQEIVYDLMVACKNIGEGIRTCPEILGNVTINRVRPQDAYGSILEGRLPTEEERQKLMGSLAKRARNGNGTAASGNTSDAETENEDHHQQLHRNLDTESEVVVAASSSGSSYNNTGSNIGSISGSFSIKKPKNE